MWPITLFLTGLLAIFASGIKAKTEGSAASPQLFSQACITWKLSFSNVMAEGWILSAYCKDSEGAYCWNDNNYLDDCVGTDSDGALIHEPKGGDVTTHCPQCNNNDGKDITSSVDHDLWCNCTNAEDGLTESSLDLDSTYGYWNNGIRCLGTPTSRARTLRARRDSSVYGQSPISSAPTISATGSVESPGFASDCKPRFQVTGNLPDVGDYSPTVMWSECVDEHGVWANTSLDLGLCLGNSNGSLVPEVSGLLNETCFGCVQEPDVLPVTLLCHCLSDPVSNGMTTLNLTTIPIEPTIEVVNGTLGCLGLYGDRGDTRPADLRVTEWDHQPSAGAQSSKQLAPRNDSAAQDYCCFWNSCSQIILTRQPEPWVYTRCRRAHEADAGLAARFDLSQAFAYDRSDWTIKPGSGLYDGGNGCKDCSTGAACCTANAPSLAAATRPRSPST